MMIKYAAYAVILCVLSSCSQNRSNSTYTEESATPQAGTFVNEHSDTLKIDIEVDSYFDEIDFDIMAERQDKVGTVFNTARLTDGTEDTETYLFQDSLSVIKSDMTFLYSYTTDSWTIEDLSGQMNSDSIQHIDYSGVYIRVND